MSAAGSGQVQIVLTLLAKTDGNVIFTSTSAPIIAIVYSGSITLTTTESHGVGQDYCFFGEERTCTFTIQFSNLTLVGGLVDDPNILTGTLNATLSYASDWSLIPQSQHGFQVSIDPSSGHTSGSVDAAVHGTYDVDHVVFWFSPLEPHLEGNFPATITVTDNNCQPPISNASQYVVVNPYEDAMLAINKIYCYEEINSSTPCVSQHITVNGVCPVFEALTAQYTCDLALTVESIQSASLAVVTERSGIVEISRAQEGTWENVVVGTVLKNGDRVRTGSNSQAKVGFKDGSYLILGSDSSFTVEGIEDPTLWDLMQGKYYFIVNLLQQWIVKKFEVRTPGGGGAVRGTEFTVEVAEDNATTFTVLEGVVDVQDRTSGSNVSLATNQKLTIPQVPGGLTPQEMSALITEVNPASVDRWWITSTPTYSLTIESSTGGSTDPPVETYTQDAGTTLAVTAYPDNGYTLDHWLSDGADAGNSNPITITFNSNHTLQPIFTQGGTAQYTLTVQTQLSSSGEGGQVTISLSQTDTLQLSVAAGQVSGTGSGQGTISVSGSFNGSPASAQFTNTYGVTGTVDEHGNASLQITQETTNAPPVIVITITTQTDQGTISISRPISVISMTQTNNFRSYGILLQNGYQETVPFPTDYRQIQGQTVITVGGTGPSTRTAGVNQGDWAQYNVSWQAGAPSSFSDVTGIKVTVAEISGTTLTINTTMQFKNGTTTPSSQFTLDVNTGQGGTTTGLDTGVIASGLNQGDLVFTSPQSPLPNAQIADVTAWTRNGFNRTAVHFKSDALGEYYWDWDTGILLYAEVPVYSGTSTPTATATLTLTGTNRFSGGSVPGGLPTSLLPLIVGAVAVVIGLIAAAVALRRHRRKKRASPPAETVKPKATLTTPPKAVEPRTPAGKKFAFCPDCGEKLPDLNAKFCPFCGARLELPETNAKTPEGAETPKEAAPEGEVGVTSEADKKRGPMKNAAKIAKHGWKLKIVVFLLIIVIATNTVYYFGVFNSTPALRPAQQIMDWIWSAPGLAQVHQALSQVVQGIRNLIPGGSNGGGVTLITPARDLTGTWVDLPGEGLVVTPLNGPHRFHYDARMDIVQHGNTFTGTMYISLWNAEALVPYSSWVDDGYWNFSYPGPVQTEEVTNGTISGVNIQFQVIGWTWKGTFTTDQMSGTVQGYSSGVSYSGVFTLRRGGTTPTGVPSAPTGVTATAGDGKVTISWSAVSGATSYNIYHSTTSGVTKTTGTKITGVTSPYTHTGLTNGMTYYYLVTAVNSSGESVESAQKSATPTAPTNSVWNIETVLPVGSVGEYPSIAVDNNGNPHISYLDYNDGYVKYAYKSGTTWSIENVGYVANLNGIIANGGLSSIALDAANNPHITYFDYGSGHFKYARKVGASWTTTIIPLPISYIPWAESSIAVDKTTGTAHVSLQMLGGDYALGYWNSGLVSAIVVDNLDGNSGYHNAIALDSNGYPSISYEARGAGNLKYAHWNGSAFNLETIAPMPLVYWEDRLTSLAIDGNNNPHIAYVVYQEGYKYAYKNGSSWTIKAIPYNSGYPSLSLSLDGTGMPHLALVGGSLKHAYWNGSSWSFDTIEDDVGRCAIAVDNPGKIHIAYESTREGTSIIKYASK